MTSKTPFLKLLTAGNDSVHALRIIKSILIPIMCTFIDSLFSSQSQLNSSQFQFRFRLRLALFPPDPATHHQPTYPTGTVHSTLHYFMTFQD